MYYNYSDINQNFQQIYDYLKSQHDRITFLEETIQQLQSQINNVKENQTSKIDKIEYRFDQLKVEKLEGTLNIGITPNHGGSSIEDFSVNQNELNIPPNDQQQTMIFENIQHQIHAYLNDVECYRGLESIERQNDYQFESHYRQHIIEDIRKQIDNRIRHYLKQIDLNNLDKEKLVEVEEMTTNKVKQDIYRTYEEFVKHLPRKENDSQNEFYSCE